uniref:Uncharacterized protein n=1 Tax=Romanomermis culicivorax TaxID=13658 RepID=A0A915JB28_ROMCU
MPSSVDKLATYKCDFSIKNSKFASKIIPLIYNAINYRSKFIRGVSNDHLLNIDGLLDNLRVEFLKIRNEQNRHLQHGIQQLVPELVLSCPWHPPQVKSSCFVPPPLIER